MKLVYLILNWVFGVLFLLMGLLSIIESPLGRVCLIAMAALLLPPVRKFIYSKTKKELPTKARAISIFILFIAFGVFIGQSQDRKAQELAAKQAQEQAEKTEQLRQEIIDYFNTNRQEIISSIQESLANKDYKAVISQSNKYLVSGDKDIKQINAEATKELEAIVIAEKEAREKAEKEEKTIEILAKLKSIKDTEYKENKEHYEQLSLLHPNNEEYKEKSKFYKGKYEQKVKEDREKAEKEEENNRLIRLGLKWNYQESEENMGRGTIKYAHVVSLNTLNFEFPYQGSQRATLQLRKHPKHGEDVIISIEKGQFKCSYNGCKVAVRFDNGKAITYNASEPSDNSTTTIFIDDYKSFVARAKKSEKIFVEAEFYQEGFNVMEFNSEGLKF
jgi:hypothetical protein